MFSLNHPPRSLKELRRDAQRVALGTAYALHPRRTGMRLPVILSSLRCALGLERRDAWLAKPDHAPVGADGFLGLAGRLDVDTLVAAYARGLYPHAHIGPKKWWSPAERMVLAFNDFRMEKDLRRMLRKGSFTVTFDRDFEGVMRACAEPGTRSTMPLTWITEDMIAAYRRLHEAGHAHSVEVWDEDGALAGGLYGVASGSVFVIESQFAWQRNASKVGFATLMRHLAEWGFDLADGKGHTPYLASLGFHPIPRAEYRSVLARRRDTVRPAPWHVDPALETGDWQPGAAPEETGKAKRGRAA